MKEQNSVFRTLDMDKDVSEVHDPRKESQFRLFSPFSEWDCYLKIAVKFLSVFVLDISKYSILIMFC